NNAREGMDAVHPGELMMPPSAVSVPPPGVALHATVTTAHTAVTDTLRDGAHEATRNAAREHLTSERTAVRESLTAERRLAAAPGAVSVTLQAGELVAPSPAATLREVVRPPQPPLGEGRSTVAGPGAVPATDTVREATRETLRETTAPPIETARQASPAYQAAAGGTVAPDGASAERGAEPSAVGPRSAASSPAVSARDSLHETTRETLRQVTEPPVEAARQALAASPATAPGRLPSRPPRTRVTRSPVRPRGPPTSRRQRIAPKRAGWFLRRIPRPCPPRAAAPARQRARRPAARRPATCRSRP